MLEERHASLLGCCKRRPAVVCKKDWAYGTEALKCLGGKQERNLAQEYPMQAR